MNDIRTLADAYAYEQSRVRELLGFYKEIGAAGAFGATMIEDVLRRADAAAISGDPVELLRMYQELQGCE